VCTSPPSLGQCAPHGCAAALSQWRMSMGGCVCCAEASLEALPSSSRSLRSKLPSAAAGKPRRTYAQRSPCLDF
jgi:hypothetical protein